MADHGGFVRALCRTYGTGASWICYFKALSVGDVNKVVPVDKSSTVLTVLLAIILFSETEHLAVKLIGTALLAAGVFLMIEKKKTEAKDTKRTWLPYAIGSAVFAALTSILGKIGITDVESNLGTAGVVSVVVPIDKLSIIVSVAFSYFVFKEKLSRKAFAGLILIVVGTLAMAIWA